MDVECNLVTENVARAYSNCARKAYLLMFEGGQSRPIDYEVAMEHRKARARAMYLANPELAATFIELSAFATNSSVVVGPARKKGAGKLNFSTLTTLYRRVAKLSTQEKVIYEPVIFTSSNTVREDDRLELGFAGTVLSKIQGTPTLRGTVILSDAREVAVRLREKASRLLPAIKVMEKWSNVRPDPPSVVLNRHCSVCEFQHVCRPIAEKEDSISQLGRISEKELAKFEKKGIFTVKQLSYLFRPRKRNLRGKVSPTVHKYELQALALRTGNIYLQGDQVEIPQANTEIFLDIESDPDARFHYLIGIVLVEGNIPKRIQFWADRKDDEESIWHKFVSLVRKYENCPIFHYGNFERIAIEYLGKKYETVVEQLLKRLFNVNNCIFGKIYLPTKSNGLKDICKYLGHTWTLSDASGAQSVAWRYWYDTSKSQLYREYLTTYNYEDCENLRLLTVRLREIAAHGSRSAEIRFADNEGGSTTEQAAHIASQFDGILKSAHGTYEQAKIALKKRPKAKVALSSVAAQKASRANKRTRRADKIIHVRRGKTCPKHHGRALIATDLDAQQTIVDLIFTASGVKKVVTRYVGKKGRCTACPCDYNPPAIRRLGALQHYGNGLIAWITYHRMALRLPFRKITQLLEDMFSEKISQSQVNHLFEQFSRHYVLTERKLLKKILASPVIHADETTVNILGTSQYVWVVTDGTHVVFRHAETREASVIHKLLAQYDGVLCTDFYAGYDAVNCMQQKCWAHLIRDLNDDLRKYPFDIELENFVSAVRDLIVPILGAVEKYGLKRRNLHKFQKEVMRFYACHIDDKVYLSSLMNTYQKRFAKYREKLFVFLDRDGVALCRFVWNLTSQAAMD